MTARLKLAAADAAGVPAELPVPTVANSLPAADILAALGHRPLRPRRPQDYGLMGGPVMGGKLGNGPGAGWAGKGVTGGNNQTGGLKVG